MIQIMGHSMLLDLKVKYKIEEEGSPNLSFTCVLFLAGLELDLVYEHPTKGQWTLYATLAADSYASPKEIELRSLLHGVSSSKDISYSVLDF
jgi:hypothetical protein